jgi:hypothetical protein
MTYLERAKLMHGRGDAVRAAYILAEGLRRDPRNAEALEWLLHLYVEEVPQPGMENDVLLILDRQPNGRELLAIVEAELRELRHEAKLLAIRKVQARDGLVTGAQPKVVPEPEPPPAPPAAPSRSGRDEAPRPVEHWDRFNSPLHQGGDGEGVPAHGDDEPPRPRTAAGRFAEPMEPIDDDYGELMDDSTRSRIRRRMWIRAGVSFVVLVIAAVLLFTVFAPPRPAGVGGPGAGSGAQP